MTNKITMHSIKGKKVSVGAIEGKNFVKEIDFEKHYYRNKEALGIDVAVFGECDKKSVKDVILVDKRNGFKYTVPLYLLASRGFTFPSGHSKYKSSFQPQQFLSIKLWRKEKI